MQNTSGPFKRFLTPTRGPWGPAGLPGAARMVVGHTIQSGGINSACEGRVLRVDVGLSKGCGDGITNAK